MISVVRTEAHMQNKTPAPTTSIDRLRQMVAATPARSLPTKRPRAKGRSANTELYLTCQREGETFPTKDSCDRAHDVRDRNGFLVRADNVANATPRRYPACHLTDAGVSHDTAAERVAAAEHRLRVLLGDVGDLGDDHGGSSAMTAAEAYHEARRRKRFLWEPRASCIPSASAVMERFLAGEWRPEE